jgi:hypothetical protein
MQKLLYVLLGALGIAGFLYFKHHHIKTADPRADDAHLVHIAMGGHDFVIPRYYLVTSPGDDAKLQNKTVQHGHGPAQTIIASFDMVVGWPTLKPVPDAVRDAPYGNAPDDKLRITVANQPPTPPETLQDYATDLQKRNIDYTSEAGPYGLTQEEDALNKSKIPVHHFYGGLYGGQLMITCSEAPGLSCSFTYPLGQETVTVAFSKALLSQWTNLYPAAVKFVLSICKD